MNIKKIGHCCLIIKTGSVTVMTDPGTYTTVQNEATGIDVVLITHEHADHFHVESVKKIMANNPNAKIVANKAVAKLLEAEGLACEIVGEGEKNDAHGVLIEGYGHLHAEIWKEMGQVENTGYFIDGKLFYPGDAFTNPNRPVDILALPVAGPWMKMKECIEYAIALKPRTSFPVHDAIYKSPAFVHGMLGKILPENGAGFVGLVEGEEKEY